MSTPEGRRVVEVPADRTHALRRLVLRDGTASSEVTFAEDHLPGTVHLGVDVDGRLVAISTWIVRCHPEHRAAPGVQLRGMATAPDHQGRGLGAILLHAGIERAVDGGAELVWARARDSALEFYRRHRFEVVGDGYVDLATGLPHHDVIRFLDS